jgi:hypothetical protein
MAAIISHHPSRLSQRIKRITATKLPMIRKIVCLEMPDTFSVKSLERLFFERYLSVRLISTASLA